MKLLIHDYGGYPFPVQLSRELAGRGFEVLHLYCSSFNQAKGNFARNGQAPGNFLVAGIDLGEPVQKYSFVKRWCQERRYGALLASAIKQFRPDAVISANTPLDAQRKALVACRAVQARFIFWLQDLLGIAARGILRNKLSVAGEIIGRHYIQMERNLLRKSDHVVVITEDFASILKEWGISAKTVATVHNWSPLEDLPLRPKQNGWAAKHGLVDKTVVLYSGTLGLKQSPEQLLHLAQELLPRDDIRVVVVAEGLGADWLARQKAAARLENLILLPLQAYHALPEVLASADILTATLEASAGIFSVPSKVLSYMCAGRALLLSAPSDNLASRIIQKHNCGLVTPPNQTSDFIQAARVLIADEMLRNALGRNARKYAENTFDINKIGDRFEKLLQSI